MGNSFGRTDSVFVSLFLPLSHVPPPSLFPFPSKLLPPVSYFFLCPAPFSPLSDYLPLQSQVLQCGERMVMDCPCGNQVTKDAAALHQLSCFLSGMPCALLQVTIPCEVRPQVQLCISSLATYFFVLVFCSLTI